MPNKKPPCSIEGCSKPLRRIVILADGPEKSKIWRLCKAHYDLIILKKQPKRPVEEIDSRPKDELFLAGNSA